MKLNPKLPYFVENKIEATKDTPYMLWEEGDEEKLQTLIRETASNNEDRDFLLKKLEEKEHLLTKSPYAFVIRLIKRLKYRKKDVGRKKVRETFIQLFPKFDEFYIVADLEEFISDYHISLRGIEESSNRLFDEGEQDS